MAKVSEYVGVMHTLKDRVKESWTECWSSSRDADNTQSNIRTRIKEKLDSLTKDTIRRINGSSGVGEDDFSHLTRHKTRKELLEVSAAVMGIEFSYAAETAFVSPLLLNIGLRHKQMSLIWCISPIVGFFLTPILGSLSDGCRSQMGRRRPFIILLSIGVILGLILVPNGQFLGRLLGDTYKSDVKANVSAAVGPAQFLDSSETPPPPTSSLQENQLNNDNISFIQNSNPSETSQSNLVEPSDPIIEKIYPVLLYDDKQSQLRHKKQNTVQAGGSDRGIEAILKLLEERGRLEKRSTKLKEELIDDLADSSFQNGEEGEGEEDEMMMGREEKSLSSPRMMSTTESPNEDESSVRNHPWALVFTIIGTVLLDFDADACQSPSRAYMLDVTIPEDHARGLSTFTVMAGLGGSIGYMLGALNWENTFIGEFFGGQVRAVFTLVLFIFIGCVITTVRSFREIPIDRLWPSKCTASSSSATTAAAHSKRCGGGTYSRFEDDVDVDEKDSSSTTDSGKNYGSTGVHETSFNSLSPIQQGGPSDLNSCVLIDKQPTFREYVLSIVKLPKSLQWLCVTNFFCWMSLVCYSLYFTDFVGEAVFGGDPSAPLRSPLRTKYEEGVRFGCWGMSLYSLSCSLYSLIIERLVSRFGAKRVYISGQLVYSVGMVFMALARHRFGVIFLSWTAGIMYATLFTMPYLLVARYHASDTFEIESDELVGKPNQIRGLGTDVAIVSSMVFLAQMTQAVAVGRIVEYFGTTTVIVCAASLFAFCGSLAATRILYLDL